MDILYQNAAVIVCKKPAGISSQDGPGDRNVPALLRAATSRTDIFTVHRLDTGTAGLMVYAKTAAAAAALSRQIADGAFTKEYLCVAHGRPAPDAGEWTDLLYHDAKKNKTYVVKRQRRGVREARLSYTRLCTAETPRGEGSLLLVRLFTGRTHQIRAQFASRGMPLFGDGRYGAKDDFSAQALLAFRLSFTDPETGRPLRFTLPVPDEAPWALFGAEIPD